MKKWITITFIIAMTFAIVSANENINHPRGNNKRNVIAAQKISEIPGIYQLAIVSFDDTVLVGIKTLSSGDRAKIKETATEQIKEYFKGFGGCLISADSIWADEVIELSLYAEAGLNSKAVKMRFKYLAEENHKI